MLLVKRAFAVVAAVLLVVGAGVPAMAVTPQEGWYIAGVEEWSGKQYYVIDNKPSTASNWLVDFYSTHIQTSSSLTGNNNLSTDVYSVLSPFYQYQGFSGDTWRIDQDWVLRVYVSSVSSNYDFAGSISNADPESVQLLLYDVTQVPTMSTQRNTSSTTWSYDIDLAESLVVFDARYSVNPSISVNDVGSTLYLKVDDFNMCPGFYSNPQGSSGAITSVSWMSLRTADINNVRVAVKAPGYWTSSGTGYATANARLGLSWMIPVDKAPEGMQVGDAWPALRPLEVELQDAWDAYKQTMLQNGQIKDPTDINSMFGNLGGMKDQGLASLEIGGTEADFFTAALSMLKPLFLTLLPVVGAGVVLIIFANKGMHG